MSTTKWKHKSQPSAFILESDGGVAVAVVWQTRRGIRLACTQRGACAALF